ncbi:hypothetical protein HXS70_00010 [Akkermansia muciniphila]|uniref:hypothetical protein n=1 Tax=Akkermansia muciniphila TaxID=239935 RepID=UPI001603FCA5|nr:hypothetical protein [Akkermansia muciniphila]QNB42363.1 hypothetical protein HXS70_00010 [Akkermansia muciniphila]
MRQWAEEEGALPLSSLTGTDIMTESRFLPAALAADFMPLGDLYETELANLFPVLFPRLRRPPCVTGFSSACTGNMNRHGAGEPVPGIGKGNTPFAAAGPRIRMDTPETAAPPHAALHPGTQETPYIHRLAD